MSPCGSVTLSRMDSLPTLNIRELERMAINEAMKQTGGRVGPASKLLGIGRATLYRRLHEDPPDTLRTGEEPCQTRATTSSTEPSRVK